MNKQQAFNTLNKFANARVELIAGMARAGYTTVEMCKPVVIQWACEKTGATFNVSTSTDKVMLDSKHAKYETAKTVVRDVMAMIEGTTRHEKAKQTEQNKKETKNPFMGVVGKFKTRAQAIKAFEQALATKFGSV
jgi:hypothetical protein